MLAKKLFIIKFRCLLTNAIKPNYLTISFQGFCLPFHCMKKRIFVLRKFVKRAEKIIFVSFCMFPFHGNIIFSELSFKRKFKKAASFGKCVFLRKYEIFVYESRGSYFLLVFRATFRWRYLSKKMNISVVLQRKQAIGQLFLEDVYIFPTISFRKRGRRIADHFFVSTLR